MYINSERRAERKKKMFGVDVLTDWVRHKRIDKWDVFVCDVLNTQKKEQKSRGKTTFVSEVQLTQKKEEKTNIVYLNSAKNGK